MRAASRQCIDADVTTVCNESPASQTNSSSQPQPISCLVTHRRPRTKTPQRRPSLLAKVSSINSLYFCESLCPMVTSQNADHQNPHRLNLDHVHVPYSFP